MTYNACADPVAEEHRLVDHRRQLRVSKAIDEANGDNGDATLFRAFPTSYNLNKQLAGFDRAQTFQFFYVYQLPFR